MSVAVEEFEIPPSPLLNYYRICEHFGGTIRPDSSSGRRRKLWGRRNHHSHQTALATHPLGVKTLILLRGVDASYGYVFVGVRGMRPEWAWIGLP